MKTCLMEREGERGREGGREGEETKTPRLVRLKTMMKLYVDRNPPKRNRKFERGKGGDEMNVFHDPPHVAR